MGLRIKGGGGTAYEPAPEGTHVAVCVQVIDLGLQYSELYDKTQSKVLIGWELPDSLNSEGKPILVWKRYTQSMHEKATLRGHIQSWRGKPLSDTEAADFNLPDILGKACLVNIVHDQRDGNTYANVSAVMALPKGTKPPAPSVKPFSFDTENWDDSVYETFSDNLKKTIEARIKPGAEKPKPKDEKPYIEEPDPSVPF